MTKNGWRVLAIALGILSVFYGILGFFGVFFKGVNGGPHSTFIDWLAWAFVTGRPGR